MSCIWVRKCSRGLTSSRYKAYDRPLTIRSWVEARAQSPGITGRIPRRPPHPGASCNHADVVFNRLPLEGYAFQLLRLRNAFKTSRTISFDIVEACLQFSSKLFIPECATVSIKYTEVHNIVYIQIDERLGANIGIEGLQVSANNSIFLRVHEIGATYNQMSFGDISRLYRSSPVRSTNHEDFSCFRLVKVF